MTVQQAIRGFVVVMLGAAVATVKFAEIGMRGGTGASLGLAIVVPVATAPAALAWWQPRARSLAIWLVIAGVFGLCYAVAGWPSRYQLTEHGAVVLAFLRLDGVLVFVALPVVLYAVAAAERRSPAVADSPIALRVRIVVRLAFGLGLALAAIGMLPGEEIYTELNGELLRVEPAGGAWLVICLIVLLAPGPVVNADPSRGLAVLWALWTIPTTLVAVFATFDLHMFTHVVRLWPRVVVELGFGTLLVLLLIVLPLAALTGRPAQPLPVARIRR